MPTGFDNNWDNDNLRINTLIKQRQRDARRATALGAPQNAQQPRRIQTPRAMTYEQKVARMDDSSRLQYLLNGNKAQRQQGMFELENRRIDAMRRREEARERQNRLNLILDNKAKFDLAKLNADTDLIKTMHTNKSNETVAVEGRKSNEAVARVGLEGQKYAADKTLEGIGKTSQSNIEAAKINADASRDVANINRNAQIGVATTEANMKLQAEQLASELKKSGVSATQKDVLNAISLYNKIAHGGLDPSEMRDMKRAIQSRTDLSEDEKNRRILEIYDGNPDIDFAKEILIDFIKSNKSILSGGGGNSGSEDEDIDLSGV